MKQKYLKIIISIISFVFCDQFIKYLVVNNISENTSVVIINNFLEFAYIKNTGAAFGILSNATIILVVIAILFMFYLVCEIKKNINDKLLIIGYILIFSGLIGNLIDRLRVGYVIDYIYFKIFNIGMPVFNLADILITFGVIIYLYKLIRGDEV